MNRIPKDKSLMPQQTFNKRIGTIITIAEEMRQARPAMTLSQHPFPSFPASISSQLFFEGEDKDEMEGSMW